MATEEHKAVMQEFREQASSKTELIRAHGARCIVCTVQIPAERERRGSVTCSNTCKEALRQRRLDNLRQQKCPHCNHPSSPEEWELYRQWRQSRGRLQPWAKKQGNPQWKAKALRFAKALEEVQGILEAMRSDPARVEEIPANIATALEISRGAEFTETLRESRQPVDAAREG